MRIARPWYRKQTGTWYVCINGKQVNLGKTEKAALAKFKKLTRTGVESRTYTVREVLKAYSKWAKSHLADSTWKRRKKTLESFSQSVSLALTADDLRAFHVQKWIDANSKKRMPVKGKGNAGKRVATEEDLSPTTVGDYITMIKGVMKWAKGMGYIDANPIEDMPKPAPRIREFFIPVEDWPKVFAAATDQEFKDYLGFMLASGARAEEIVKFEAKHLNGNRFILPVALSKGRKKARVVYIPNDALEIVKRLAKKYPEGKLFRNSKGEPWNRNSVNCRMRRLKTELNMPGLCATSLRHSFAHHRVTSGQDALTVSKLMSHADTRMLSTRYGHLDANADFMTEASNLVPMPVPLGIVASPTPVS